MDDQLAWTEILLVEDNPCDVEMVLHTLKKFHLANRVYVVKDGEEALDFIFRRGRYSCICCVEKPKVILLDIKLPKVDGIEVLRQIRANPETKTMPVVILTSSKESKDIEDCYLLGVNSYIVKPTDFTQFVEAVRNLGLYWLLINQPPGFIDHSDSSENLRTDP